MWSTGHNTGRKLASGSRPWSGDERHVLTGGWEKEAAAPSALTLPPSDLIDRSNDTAIDYSSALRYTCSHCAEADPPCRRYWKAINPFARRETSVDRSNLSLIQVLDALKTEKLHLFCRKSCAKICIISINRSIDRSLLVKLQKCEKSCSETLHL